MKILVIAPTPFFSNRGTHIRILEEALALEKLGHRITIATYHIGRDIGTEVDTRIDVRRIRRLLFWYKKLEAGPDWQKVILDIMLIRKVFYLARTQKPDIIHGHLHEGALIGWIVQKILFWRKMKLVADFHGSLTKEMVSHGYLKRGLNRIFLKIEKLINNLGDRAIASSWEGASDVSSARKKDDCELLLDGVNLDSFDVKKSKKDIRHELELPEEQFIVGYTGGLVTNKGIDYLLDAIHLVLEKRPDIFFLIGGFPAHQVESFIRNHHLERSVRLVSPLDYFKLPEILKACDIAVDPKDCDTAQASGKMLNYMAAGLPVVCFDKPNNRKFLGESAYFCHEISSKDIAEGILHLAGSSPGEIMEKGEANRKRVVQFSWSGSGKKLDGIYKSLK
jgi:glycosyltransferase involved in cell wall biosynthesis